MPAMRTNSAAWPGLKPDGRCHATGQPIPPGEPYVVVILDLPDGLERREYLEPPTDVAEPLAMWRTTMPDATARDRRAQRQSTVATLRSLVELEPQDDRAILLRLAATLLLIRKRRLTLLEATPDHLRVVFTGGEPFHVEQPAVSEAKLADAVDELVALTETDA